MGVGSEGSGMKETWRTGVVFTIEWMVSASYVPGRCELSVSCGKMLGLVHMQTSFLVPIEFVIGGLRIFHDCR